MGKDSFVRDLDFVRFVRLNIIFRSDGKSKAKDMTMGRAREREKARGKGRGKGNKLKNNDNIGHIV